MEFTVPEPGPLEGVRAQQSDPLHEQGGLHLPHENKAYDQGRASGPGEQRGRDRCQQSWQFNAILCLLTNNCHFRGYLEGPRLAVDTRGTARIAPPGEHL